MKKTIQFKNSELLGIANILGSFKLKGKASLGRSVLIHKLAAKQDEYLADRVEVQNTYFESDDQGNLKTLDNSEKLIPKKDFSDANEPSKLSSEAKEKLDKEMKDLADELVGIDFTEYSPRFKALKAALDDYPYEVEKDEAVVYSIVYDQLEDALSNTSKEEN